MTQNVQHRPNVRYVLCEALIYLIEQMSFSVWHDRFRYFHFYHPFEIECSYVWFVCFWFFIMPMLANARISIRYETREWPKKAAPNNLSYGIIAFIFQSNLLAFFFVWTKTRDQKSNTKNFPVSIPFSPGYLKHKIMKTFLTSWSMKFFVWNKLPKLHWNISCSGSQIGLERFRITVLPKIGFFDQAAYKCCKCSLSNSLAASNHLAQK